MKYIEELEARVEDLKRFFLNFAHKDIERGTGGLFGLSLEFHNFLELRQEKYKISKETIKKLVSKAVALLYNYLLYLDIHDRHTAETTAKALKAILKETLPNTKE